MAPVARVSVVIGVTGMFRGEHAHHVIHDVPV